MKRSGFLSLKLQLHKLTTKLNNHGNSQQQSGHPNFKNQLKAHFFKWTISCLLHSSWVRWPYIGLHVTTPKKLTLHYCYHYEYFSHGFDWL